MKHIAVILIVALLVVMGVAPAYANTRQENNKNIANFILDTIKLPWILMGEFTNHDHDQVVQDMDYKDHGGLDKALRGETQFIGK